MREQSHGRARQIGRGLCRVLHRFAVGLGEFCHLPGVGTHPAGGSQGGAAGPAPVLAPARGLTAPLPVPDPLGPS